MRIPGPDHPIIVERHARRVRVVFNGRIVAESANALRLQEADYRPVFYILRDDADMRCFQPSTHKTYCPYKGEASHFTLAVEGKEARNAAWSYETPYPAVADICEYLAFYPSRVDAIDEL